MSMSMRFVKDSFQFSGRSADWQIWEKSSGTWGSNVHTPLTDFVFKRHANPMITENAPEAGNFMATMTMSVV
jgi:hypothetical protein